MDSTSANASGTAAATSSRPCGFIQFASSDAVQLSQQAGEWNFEVSQLSKGTFSAESSLLELDSVSLLHIGINQTVLQRGYAPPNMTAVFMPRAGSAQAFANGQLLEAGQCVTVAGGELEGTTHAGYVETDLAFDMVACLPQLEALNGGSIGVLAGTTIAAPGPDWTTNMAARVEWILKAAREYPGALGDARLRKMLTDHLLAAMVCFDTSPADLDATTTRATASRRVGVRLARDYIHAHLADPLPLSELCRHSKLKVRTLETGFREVTGLTPVAYVRCVRLNGVRRALHDASLRQRSISDIAMDNGFWHFGQFALDYRRQFGESPTGTRRRSMDIS